MLENEFKINIPLVKREELRESKEKRSLGFVQDIWNTRWILPCQTVYKTIEGNVIDRSTSIESEKLASKSEKGPSVLELAEEPKTNLTRMKSQDPLW